jgi:hypothetical protein
VVRTYRLYDSNFQRFARWEMKWKKGAGKGENDEEGKAHYR